MKERIILHSDLNNFYASVECLYHPEYRGKPLAVLGDPEARHGIVLAKNYEVKKFEVQTGDPMRYSISRNAERCGSSLQKRQLQITE